MILFVLILWFLMLLGNSSVCMGSAFLHSPYEGAQVRDYSPSISFSFGSRRPVPATLKFLVNGEDVTNLCVITPAFISFKPRDPLPGGRNFVSVEYFTSEGKKVDYTWNFEVLSLDLIDSVTHDGISPLMAKETITVTLTGKPGCTGVFDIGTFKKDIPLKEIQDGVYQGTYTVEVRDHAVDEPIIGRLIDENGTISEMQTRESISIFAQLFRLKILSPRDGDRAGKSFVVRGRTRPNVVIHFSAQLGYTNTDFFTARGPDTGGMTTISDSEGIFEKHFGFPLFMKGMKCSISAYARDENKLKSNIEEITVYYDETDLSH